MRPRLDFCRLRQKLRTIMYVILDIIPCCLRRAIP
jgi:hypothetical protein